MGDRLNAASSCDKGGAVLPSAEPNRGWPMVGEGSTTRVGGSTAIGISGIFSCGRAALGVGLGLGNSDLAGNGASSCAQRTCNGIDRTTGIIAQKNFIRIWSGTIEPKVSRPWRSLYGR